MQHLTQGILEKKRQLPPSQKKRHKKEEQFPVNFRGKGYEILDLKRLGH